MKYRLMREGKVTISHPSDAWRDKRGSRQAKEKIISVAGGGRRGMENPET